MLYHTLRVQACAEALMQPIYDAVQLPCRPLRTLDEQIVFVKPFGITRDAFMAASFTARMNVFRAEKLAREYGIDSVLAFVAAPTGPYRRARTASRRCYGLLDTQLTKVSAKSS
ncbi:hypothetical protein [Burkholderia ambifaria]|uniref:hypothetical protein n=1 Tax=Burkholderia ambifaria TaxID=152480 RepID=UPI00158FF559|nr:hypothetical protein [Burkholderia ambifaria]